MNAKSILEKIKEVVGEKGHIENVGWDNQGKLDEVMIYYTGTLEGISLQKLKQLGEIDYLGLKPDTRSNKIVLAIGLDLRNTED